MGLNSEWDRLGDESLVERARNARQQASQGDRSAFGMAHELEKEMRRRGLLTASAPEARPLRDDEVLAMLPISSGRRWWRLWRTR